MVKRRGGRRSIPIRVQSCNSVPEESEGTESTGAVISSSASPASNQKNSLNPYLLSPSKLEGLVSEKSLFVEVVDIQKSKSKVITGVNYNVAPLQINEKSSLKVQTVNSIESVSSNLSPGVSSSRNKAVGIVSRVVTRSRRVADSNNTVIDKVTTVGVIKTNKRVSSRSGVKTNSVANEINDHLDKKQLSSIVNCEKPVENVKCELLSQTDDEDPCLSGDIMYEQIIEDDTEETVNMDTNVKQVVPISMKTDDEKAEAITFQDIDLTSSVIDSVITKSIEKENKIVDMAFGAVLNDISNSNNSKTSSIDCDLAFDSNVSIAEYDNIKALSSLKLDSGAECVSSSQTESYFGPIFSIDDNSSDQTPMVVELEVSEECIQKINNSCEVIVNESFSGSSVSNSDLKNTNPLEKADEVPRKAPVISYEKIVTRSRSSVSSSVKPPNLNVTSKVKSKKKTKGEIKEVACSEFTVIESSSPNSNIGASESIYVCENNKDLQVDSGKDSNNVLSDTNDSDTPLVVNRCITDETRKYMGPKGIIKNNFCNSTEANCVRDDFPSKTSSEISASPTHHPTTETEQNIHLEEADINLDQPDDKTKPLSPKEQISSSSEITLAKDNSDNKIDVELRLVSDYENSAKSDTNDPKESAIEDCSMKPADGSASAQSDSGCNNIENKVKAMETCEQAVRRSQRNNSDRNKKTAVSLKEKQEKTGPKTMSSGLLQDKHELSSHTPEKFTPGKSTKMKSSEKPKKEIVTMSSMLNEKLKPMSPKELIKKTFIANESRSMEHPLTDPQPDKNLSKVVPHQSCSDDNEDTPDKMNTKTLNPPGLPEQSSNLSEIKKTEFVIDKGKLDLKHDSSPSNNVLLNFDIDKPVKVKSRWRRTSELEMGKIITPDSMDIDSSSRLSFGEDSKSETDIKPLMSLEDEKLSDETIVAKRMNSFIHIDSNEYLTERYISKETKRMVCDCTLTKEEMSKGEKGCGEDCLNRLLLIECGSRCPLGKQCSNKCFMNRDYTQCSVVNMANKGVGVISTENVSSDRFIMEYVGEVLDPKEFRKRAKEYAKENVPHFYFMSLKADTVIDATHKGNISRFINHSCDPNAETQKWTVNGELRIGFFSKRPIAIGEEITFDYQLERYGKEAQKCYCGSANCRGWLGENPDNDESEGESDDESEESSEEETEDVKVSKDKFDIQDKKLATVKIKKEKKKLPNRRKEISDTTFNPDGDLEEEIDKLSISGVKNQKHTLALSRLIVRVTEERCKIRLLDLIKSAATPCLRLFLDYHGLNLLWSWMVDPRTNIKLKSMIIETLFVLPIQNKTILKDSKVLNVIEKWASGCDSKSFGDSKERGSTEEENSNSPSEDKNEISDTLGDYSKMDSDMESLRDRPELVNQAGKLLEDWANLKEEFRIPRKQRVEQMKEHEREADMEYSDPRENLSYNRRRFRDRKESRFDKVREGRFETKKDEWSNWQNQMGKMSKAERRQLFAERVKREEREKREAEELWKSHQAQCKALGVNPSQTAMFHPQLNALAFYHKETNCWMPYQEGAESYGGGDGGVVVDHHQPPPHYQLDYQGGLPPGGPGYYQQGYQPCFGQFNQALLFQPPPPPPPQQFNIPPHPQHPPQYQPPLPPGQPFQQGYILPQGPPLLQPGPLLPPQGPPLPQQIGPPLTPQPGPNQLCPPLPHQIPPLPFQGPPLPQQGPPLPQQIPSLPQQGPPLPQQGPPLPRLGPPLPQQGPPLPQQAPPLPRQGPPLPQQQSNLLGPLRLPLPPQQRPTQSPLPSQNHQTFHQGPPIQSPLPSPQVPLALSSPSPHPPLPSIRQAPPLPGSGPQPSPQPTTYTQDLQNPMEVQTYSAEQLQISSAPLKLPPKWKTAKDKEGRLYYYHVKKRVSQWIFPYAAAAAAFNSEPTSDSSSEDSSISSSEEEEEEDDEEEDSSEVEQENSAPIVNQNETEEMKQDSDMTVKKRKSKKEDDSLLQAKKLKESSLVSTIIIPREEAAEMIGITKKKIRDNKEKVKREKARAARKQRQQVTGTDFSSTSASVSSKCEADTSSGPKKKIKETFMLKMADVVVTSLNQYRKHDCKVGRITSTKDFKSLAKKLTHFIMVKELKHCINVEDLVCNDNVKHKARDFIRKYMLKFGPVYVNPKED